MPRQSAEFAQQANDFNLNLNEAAKNGEFLRAIFGLW
jgi:hypothetical protein